MAGWWWLEHGFYFPYIGNNHPNWLFFRGVETTNQMVTMVFGPEILTSTGESCVRHLAETASRGSPGWPWDRPNSSGLRGGGFHQRTARRRKRGRLETRWSLGVEMLEVFETWKPGKHFGQWSLRPPFQGKIDAAVIISVTDSLFIEELPLAESKSQMAGFLWVCKRPRNVFLQLLGGANVQGGTQNVTCHA